MAKIALKIVFKLKRFSHEIDLPLPATGNEGAVVDGTSASLEEGERRSSSESKASTLNPDS